MPPHKKRPHLYYFIRALVASAILGALGVSIASVLENLRFSEATSEILWFARTVRSFANAQQTLSFAPGQDVWDSMVQAKQISASTRKHNPWNGEFGAVAIPNAMMRVETTNIPTHDCRRLALYFSQSKVPEFLIAIDIQSDQDPAWYAVYPPPLADQVSTVEATCGTGRTAQMDFVFKIN
jgi:hypothetical protein